MNKQKRKVVHYLNYRDTKVFAAALISIGIGAIALNIIGNSPPPAGAFSLSEYYHLAPIEKVISSNIAQADGHWNRIEISYSSTEPIGLDKWSSRSASVNYDVFNCHFIVWNGLIGGDGQIQSTEKWQKQLSAAPGQTWYCSEQTIRIGVIANSKTAYPTDFQIKKTEALVETLSRMFDIRSASIYYPDMW